MAFQLNITETGNAAFEDNGTAREIARILRTVAEDLERNQAPRLMVLWDANGNRVGTAELFEGDDN